MIRFTLYMAARAIPLLAATTGAVTWRLLKFSHLPF